MKKLLSVLLCMCIILSLVPFVASAAESTDDSATSTETLEKFGFTLDPESYDTNALRPGTHPVSPKYDLYVQNNTNIQKYTSSIITNTVLSYAPFGSTPATYSTSDTTDFAVSTSFASTSTGVADHIAKVSFKDGRDCGIIQLSIYDANGNTVISNEDTQGRVVSVTKGSDYPALQMWDVEGLLAISAGDYDGDGQDEIAVYLPNNYNETQDKSTANVLNIGIYDFDATNKQLLFKGFLRLGGVVEQGLQWRYSYNGSIKRYSSIPYVALTSEDLNNDGIDDLAAVVSFSTWFRDADGNDTYTTKQIINHNTNFASVLETYEGALGSNVPKRGITHRVLVTDELSGGSSDSSVTNRFILRNANITVGDVTQEGSREIIIAGNYTRASVKSTTDSTTKVTSNRYVEVDGNHSLCHIVGYTTYDNLKNYEVYNKNSGINWTVQRTGNDWTYWYNEDSTDAGPITTSLTAFKLEGTGKPDTIFVGGQLFGYDSQEGKLKFLYDYDRENLYHGTNDKKRETSVVWIGKSVAGNFSDDPFGRETLVFPFYLKVKGEEKYTGKLLTLYEAASPFGNGGTISNLKQIMYAFEDVGQRLCSLTTLDGSGKTSYITYDGNNTEIYYSNVEALAIMQAPPLYEELGILDDGDHIGNSGTSFAKSEGTSSSTSHGGSLTAGVVTGFEHETSFLGLFRVAGAEYELSITGTVSYDHETETSIEYTCGFETTGTKDSVVVFTVPYVRYNCTMYVPEYKLPTQSDYKKLCKFRDELAKNLGNYVKTGNEQVTGTYVNGCDYFQYKYNSYINESNYNEQQDVLYKVAEEIDFIEKAIAACGKGGTGEWNGTVQKAVLPYNYSVPQSPILATLDVETYDAIADVTPGLEKIYGNVFPEWYKAGDPNTYAHYETDLNATGDVLKSKQTVGSPTDGFLTNSNISAEGSAQSQTITVEKSTADTIGWGAAIENTSLAMVGPAKVGFTVTAEYNGSSTRTTTEGNEYSGTVVALPSGTPANYTYGWKLVSYTALLNGKKVPVVGYLTKVTSAVPPSVAQNISVEKVTDKSATLTWEDGSRKPDYYSISRVAYDSNNNETYYPLASYIESVDGQCSYTINNLQPSTTTLNTSHYVIESHYDDGQKSIASQVISVTTLPEGFAIVLSVDGIDEHVNYRPGKEMEAQLIISGNEAYDTYYQWQKDTGDGWKNIKSETSKLYDFELSTLDDQSKIRCVATIFVNNLSYTVYSNPVTLNCANSVAGHTIDWDSDVNAVTIKSDEDAAPANLFLSARNADGVVTHVNAQQSSADGVTFRLDDVTDEDLVKVYIWNDLLSPITMPFVK